MRSLVVMSMVALVAADPKAPRRNNGITGDARRSSAELGRRMFEQRVDYAVRQIQQFIR